MSCPGTPAVRYSQMIDPPSIDEVDHPAVDVLRGELDAPGGETLPRGRWVVISIDDDRATFAALADGGFGVAGVERQGDKWIFAGEASGRPCEPVVPLPAGLASVEVRLDLDSSMALCLARSLVECGGFDATDQMQRYVRWWREGYLSSTGTCFDIENTVSAALSRGSPALVGVASAAEILRRKKRYRPPSQVEPVAL